MQVEQPLVIGLTQLVADAEHSELHVVVSCKNLDLPLALEHKLDY